MNPEPKLIGKETDDSGEVFFVYENVPILDEHTDDEGVQYDRRLLSEVARNNNDRIEDTGDLVPIVEHHTDDENNPETDPEVFGYAGPFTVARFGKKKPRWAIYAAKWKIRASKHDEAKKRPRRSVEIWPEDTPENRYIDPIALLGAETPRRDLGLLRYSKKTPKKRYSIAAGTNTFMPSGDISKKEPKKNSKGTEMLSPDDMTQLIEAMKPMVESMVSEMTATANDPTDSLVEEPEMDELGLDDMPMDGMDEMGMDEEMPLDDTAVDGEAEELGEGMDMENEDEDEFGAAQAKQFRKRFMKSEGSDEEGAKQYLDSMDDGDYGMLEQYAKSCDDEDFKEMYSKCGRGRDISDPDCDGMGKSTLKYAKKMKGRYQKVKHELEGLKRRYSKAVEVNSELKAQATDAKVKARCSKRRSQLTAMQMREGIVLDVDEEMGPNGGSTMNESQWENHTEGMRKRYQRVPIENVPGLDEAIVGKPKRYGNSSGDKRQQYSKKARQVVIEARSKGKDVEYKSVLNHMVENDTDKYPIK